MRPVGLACTLLLVLCACGRQPTPIEPTSTPSSARSATPTPQSTLKPPELPAVANRNDETGAANFVVYWVKVSNYSAVTGETDVLREISAPNCEGCNRYISLYERTYAAGGSFHGGDRQLREIEAQSDGSAVFVTGNLVAEPGSFRAKAGARLARSAAESTRVTFQTRFDGSEWVMADVGLSGA